MTHVFDLATNLPKHEFQPVIIFFTGGPAIEEAERRRIPVYLILRKRFRLLFLLRLCRFLIKQDIKVLHTHTLNANFYGRIAGKLAGVPVLLTTVHSLIIDELKGLKKPSAGDYLRYKADLFLSRMCNNLVAVSGNIKERMTTQGIPAEKIHVIPNAVDTDKFQSGAVNVKEVKKEFGFSPESTLVGIIGRVVPLKNHAIFLKAARQLSNRLENVNFLVVGDGPLLESMKRLSRELGLGGRVVFTGWRLDVERIMPALDVLVLCSQVEGLNITVLESMACEVPVVGTDVPGINSIVIHDNTGILVPVGDIETLTDALHSLLNDSAKAKAMGRAARKYILDNFSMDRLVSSYIEVYSSTLRR